MKRIFFGALALWGAGTLGCERESAISGVPPGRTWSYSGLVANSQILQADILLVVDNSPSMREKQALLVQSIPHMVRRLAWPRCVDSDGNTFENQGTCPGQTGIEFTPIRDINVAVITTSLGGHGSSTCPRDVMGKDDRAHFIPRVRDGVPDPEGTGFLKWRGGDLEDMEEFTDNIQAHIQAVGASGCEYPAPLEAWYRALVDPSPPAEIVLNADGFSEAQRTDQGGLLLDGTVLLQREEFLRPESLVSIIVVSDRDDCSIMDGGLTHAEAGLGHRLVDLERPMARATEACNADPEDPCCASCERLDDISEACDVSACEGEIILPPELDRANVRCFDTKRRFGIDATYPIERYVTGLSRVLITDDRTGQLVDNPLLRGSGRDVDRRRDPGLVFFGGIVGVPWQDVATNASLTNSDVFELRSAQQLAFRDIDINGELTSRWDVLRSPLDPFLIPSIEPRTEGHTNPISGDTIVSPGQGPGNSINGREADHSVSSYLYSDGGPANDRLQASCMFPLREPLECELGDATCLCADEPSRGAPACRPPEGGDSGRTQYFGQAYPAPRILQVLHEFGSNSIVAPICPKFWTSGDPSDPNFGFNPAVEALTWRLSEKITRRCFPPKLPVDEEGQVSCVMVEAWPPGSYWSMRLEELDEQPCDMEGRSEVSATTREYVLRQLESSGRCDGNTEIPCDDYDMCLIEQLEGEEARPCLFDPYNEDEGAPGFCYIDPEARNAEGEFVAGGGLEEGNPIVKSCPAGERRLLRTVGVDTPRPNTVTIAACQMLDLNSTSDAALDELSWFYPRVETPQNGSNVPPPAETR